MQQYTIIKVYVLPFAEIMLLPTFENVSKVGNLAK